MDQPNRRRFLVSSAIAGAGVAAAGTGALAPAAGAETVPAVADHVKDPIVAYVRDAHAGEVAVMIGEREVVVHDHDLAARIARVVS